MKIEITNGKILDLLGKKDFLAKDNLRIIEEMNVLEKQMNKNIAHLKRLDEKVRPKIIKIIPELKEYEQMSRVYEDKGKWYMECIDRLEEFKNRFNEIEKTRVDIKADFGKKKYCGSCKKKKLKEDFTDDDIKVDFYGEKIGEMCNECFEEALREENENTNNKPKS